MTAVRRKPGELPVEHDLRERASDLVLDFAAIGVIGNITRVSDALRSHLERTALARPDLSWSAYAVLHHLWVSGDTDTRELAEHCGVSKGVLTGAVNVLEERGLVQRRPQPDDRRFVLVKLTASGKRLIAKLVVDVNAEEVSVVRSLTGTEQTAAAGLLRRLVVRLDELQGDNGRSA
jgi:DNA-binding MarR family transcriptional regulator